MDEADEGIRAIENSLATPVPNTDVIREVINKVDEDTGVTADIDDAWEITSVPTPEGFIELIDLTVNDITMNENFVAIPGRSIDGISGIEDRVAKVKMENREATFMPKTEDIGEIMDQEYDGINVIENLVATSEQSTEGVSRFAEVNVKENLKATSVSGTEEVVTKIMDLDEISVTESLAATLELNPKRIYEVIEQANEGICAFEDIEAMHVPSTERVSGISDKIDESFDIIENLETTKISGTEVFSKTMDLDEISAIKSFVETFGSNPKRIYEILEQANEGISAFENIEAMPLLRTEKVSEISDKIAESFRVIENLKTTPVSGTEVFTKTMDLDEVSITENVAATFASNPKRNNEIMGQTTESISAIENIEAMAVPSTERISGISDKIDESFDVIENSEAIPSSITNDVTLFPNKNTTKIVFDKATRNMENEAETETSTIINGEVKKLKIVYRCDGKGRKRKISHPPISEMVMDSIKSIKKSSGVSFEDIKTDMEENYQVTVKALLKYHVNNFLRKWVEDGILEKVDEADMGARFKIKENENSCESNCTKQAKKLKMN